MPDVVTISKEAETLEVRKEGSFSFFSFKCFGGGDFCLAPGEGGRGVK